MNTQEIISRIRKNLNVCTDELYKISKLFSSNIEKPYLENTRRFKPLDQRLRLRGIYANIIVNELIINKCINERIKDKIYKILKPIINDLIDDINNVSKFDLINLALIGGETE